MNNKRFFQLGKHNDSNKKEEIAENLHEVFKSKFEFHHYFETNHYTYKTNLSITKDSYIHLMKIPKEVLESIELGIKHPDNEVLWQSIINNKNKRSSSLVKPTYVPLKNRLFNLDKLNISQKEYYYYLREQLLLGNFIDTDINYLFLFIFEGLHYQLSNNVGFTISLLDRVYKHYRKNSAYKHTLDVCVPFWIRGLLIECNEIDLAAEYWYQINKVSIVRKNPILSEFLQEKRQFSVKKFANIIPYYHNEFYDMYRDKIDLYFTHLLFIYQEYKQKHLINLFSKKVKNQVLFVPYMFEKARIHRKINYRMGYEIDLSLDVVHMKTIFKDLYALAYYYYTHHELKFSILSKEEVNDLYKLLDNLLKNERKKMNNTELKGMITELKNDCTTENLIALLKDDMYPNGLGKEFIDNDIPMMTIPNNLIQQHAKTLSEYGNSENFRYLYDMFSFRIFSNIDYSEDFDDILMKGVTRYQNVLKNPLITNAYLYYREQAMKGNFIQDVSFRYIEFLVVEAVSFNLTNNPQKIVGFLKMLLDEYKEHPSFIKNKLKDNIELCLQSFLRECQLDELANQYVNTIKLEKTIEGEIINRIQKIDLYNFKTINQLKDYITIYDVVGDNKSKMNKYFKELLTFYIDTYKEDISSKYIRDGEKLTNYEIPYLKIGLPRKVDNVVEKTMYQYFELDSFKKELTEIYYICYQYQQKNNNETNALDSFTFEQLDENKINDLMNYLEKKYTKKTKEQLKQEQLQKENEEFRKTFFQFDNSEIEKLKELHGVIKEEEQQNVSNKANEHQLDISILKDFVALFDEDDSCSVDMANQFVKERKLSLGKLIKETNKQLKTNIVQEDDMLYND